MALGATRDAYVQYDDPWRNRGDRDTVEVQSLSGGEHRALVAFDQAAILDYVGSDSLVSATLEMPILEASYLHDGYPLAVHRMTVDWDEFGATWQCPNDANTTNNITECSTDTWSMTGAPYPFVTAATAIDTAFTGESGPMSWDVTADVEAFLAGSTPNFGWIVMSPLQPTTSRVRFASRESGSGPVLRIATAAKSGGDGGGDSIPASYAHVPSTYSLIAERHFDAKSGEDGWYNDIGSLSNLDLVAASEDPISPTGAVDWVYAAGFLDGSAPETEERDFSGVSELFIGEAFRYSTGWVSHPTHVNKRVHVWVDTRNRVFTNSWGTSGGDFKPVVSLQGVNTNNTNYDPSGSGSFDLMPNVGTDVTFEDGAPVVMETQIILNSASGVRDGVVRWWLNGTKVGEYTDIDFLPAGAARSMRNVKISPTWGGQTNPRSTVPAEQRMRYYDLVLYGK